MSLAHGLSAYITLNVLVVAGCLNLMIYSFVTRVAKRKIGASSRLKLHYAVLSMLIFLLLLSPFFPDKEVFKPAIKIWSGQSMKTFTADNTVSDNVGYLSLPGLAGGDSLGAGNIKLAGIILISVLLIAGAGKISHDLYRLFIIRKGSYLIRRYRSVYIFANDWIKVPFSYWLPGQANIVIPTGLLGKGPYYRVALYHEFQHHRNGDTKWVYVIWFLRSICIFNPCIHLWNRMICELQEFACDEALIDSKRIDSQLYARCLFETAKSALGLRDVPVCATGLTFMVDRQLLKRRIENMYMKIHFTPKRQISLMVMILIMAFMIPVAFASKGTVQDRRVTESQAVKMAEKAKLNAGFPIVVNDLVIRQLNIYLGTPEGREFMKKSLQRMENYRKGIEAKLEQYGVPEEFLAMPIVESGYRNLEQVANKHWGAGIWMFIDSTARDYGLKVNDTVDERLDVDLLTDAAMRYLSASRLRFNDWQLSVLAYNMGASKVQEAIDKTGSRDAWEIVRAGYENDKDYYPKFMAAIIIMKNPGSVN